MACIGAITGRKDQFDCMDVQGQTLVIEKIGNVYAHVAGCFGISSLTAFGAAASGLCERVIIALSGAGAASWMTGMGLLATGIGLVVSICFTPKEESLKKLSLFGAFAVYQGLILSPLVLLNAPAFIGASIATTGIMAGLSTLALKMQTQFEKYEKILFVALSALTVVSLGAVFLPGVAGAAAHQLSVVGGLGLFGAYTIYDTQKMRDAATLNPDNFDVIDHAMNIYLDAVGIMVRIYNLLNKEEN